MEKHILTAFLVFLAFGLIASSASAIAYDFEKGIDDWTSVSGDWSVEDGELVQSNAEISAMRILVGDENWTDYTIECKIKITNGSYTGVAFRAISDKEYYVFYMNANENVVELWRHTGPGDTDRLQVFKHVPSGGVQILANEWYDVRLVIEGGSGEFYVNDELQDSVADLENDHGRVGAWAWTTEILVDDFSISGPGIPEAPVEPKEKMTLTWGDIKTKRALR
jgi:hypothetical protein